MQSGPAGLIPVVPLFLFESRSSPIKIAGLECIGSLGTNRLPGTLRSKPSGNQPWAIRQQRIFEAIDNDTSPSVESLQGRLHNLLNRSRGSECGFVGI